MGSNLEADAATWLAAVTEETVATVAASPTSTIVPPLDPLKTGDRQALADLVGDLHRVVLREVIGEGGMGVVRAADQVSLGRTVAVKTLKPSLAGPAAALDLLREAWVTGSLEHPSIVPVHYLTFENDTPSIVLKRIEGVEWSRLLDDESEVARRFGTDDLLAWNLGILMQVLNALRFAHSHGIVHRDLKPSNVMIGDYGEVYLLDWGIAVSTRDDSSGRLPLARNANQLAGTPSYMAPEMLGGADRPPPSERTDVYLAGAVLFQLIAGHPPHRGDSALAVIASVIASRPELPKHAPEELARICARAMHHDPDARFESIDVMQSQLRLYLAHRGSAQLAARAHARLAELISRLAPRADVATTSEDIYRLFGACRYGFRDALAIWPENDDARRGLVSAVGAVAEFELAADRPQAALSLLGELEEPHPLLAAARAAAEANAKRVKELEHIGREHDTKIGTRTRMIIGVIVGLPFSIAPLLHAHVPAVQFHSSMGHMAWALGLCVFIAAVGWWGRETLAATAINRRLIGALLLLFAVQGLTAMGAELGGVPHHFLWVTNLVLYVVVSGMVAIAVDSRVWPLVPGYAVAFLVAAREPTLAEYATAAGNGWMTAVVVWRLRQTAKR